MKNIGIIFLGGGIGSASRYIFSKWISTHSPFIHLPFGTMMVNIVSCAILGLSLGLSIDKEWMTPAMKLFVGIGFCGGFSTFSAFSNDSLALFQKGEPIQAMLNIFLSVSLCLFASFLGTSIGVRL